MKSKYYTPRLEEFRIGFEYEELNAGEWSSYKIEYGYDIDDAGRYEPIRVKYLDRSDIESCGFEWLGEVTSHAFQMNNNEIRLKYSDDSNELFISHESRRKLFDGVVKNLSEFKMILDMIGVEYGR